MDDFDRDSNASSDNEHEQEHEHEQEDDLTMQDVDPDEDNDNPDHDDDENENDNDDDEEDEQSHPDRHDDDDDETHDHAADTSTVDGTAADASTTSNPVVKRTSATPGPLSTPKWQPTLRPEVLNARTYDIVPTMAAPMATSINAMAITPDLRYWMTGGSDGYIRKYDGPATINGKTLLTVAQRHPFVDSVTKAGVLMSYWENAEQPSASARQDDVQLSPVYSLAVNSSALWLLSGLESGGINLQSVRHDEGKRITCLQKHTNAVSVLSLASDERSVLSGSWDKNIFDWDLNTGRVTRQFDANGGQISAIEIRPMGGAPIPPEASEEAPSDTFFSTNGQADSHDDFGLGLSGDFGDLKTDTHDHAMNGNSAPTDMADGGANAAGSPAHDSLFGGSPTGGSDLFGDNDAMGAFDGDEENEFSRAMMQDSAREADANMGDFNMSDQAFGTDSGPAPAVQPPPDAGAPDSNLFGDSDFNAFNGDASAGNHNGDSMDHTDHGGSSSFPALPESGAPTAGDDSFGMGGMTDASQATISATQGQPQSPSMVFAAPPPTHHDLSQTSDSTFLSASIDGPLRIWDRRVPNPVARIGNRVGVPPWCMGACWSPDGNWIHVGRRNGTVEEFNIHKARASWQPERIFKFPNGSGPVSAVRPMANGRHLVCASHDILRLYDLRAEQATKQKHSPPPFLIIPGPPRAGVIAGLYIDAENRFMLSAAGNRGWEGTTTEVLIGYEISVPPLT
ncbi:WD40 repeat-like protein [Xylariomycetidae sp. FL0641]|nr:WD40 repeat-like protein [Xylariomycetidae sp. FL0641]